MQTTLVITFCSSSLSSSFSSACGNVFFFLSSFKLICSFVRSILFYSIYTYLSNFNFIYLSIYLYLYSSSLLNRATLYYVSIYSLMISLYFYF